jgi:hypothetical protein
MSEEERIHLDGNRPATLHNGTVSTDFATLQDAIMAWHRPRPEQAQRATIRVIGGPLHTAPRLHYGLLASALAVLRNLGGQNVVLFARCASVWGRASIDWTGGDGTRDSGDDKSGEPS